MRLITVNENPTARPIQVIPLVVACIKLTNPKNTHTASQPILNLNPCLDLTMIKELTEGR